LCIAPVPTKTGFDQENNAPDKAKETQSAGVPDIEVEKKIKHLAFLSTKLTCNFKVILELFLVRLQLNNLFDI